MRRQLKANKSESNASAASAGETPKKKRLRPCALPCSTPKGNERSSSSRDVLQNMPPIEELRASYGLPPRAVQPIHEVQDSDCEVIEQAQSPPSKKAKTTAAKCAPTYMEYWDSGRVCVVRASAGKILQCATMLPGPEGLLMAKFDAEEAYVTEVPNLVLEAKTSRTGSHVIQKKPSGKCKAKAKAKAKAQAKTKAAAKAKAAAEPADQQAGKDEQPKQERPHRYQVLYYKNGNSAAIKKFGPGMGQGKQVLSFGGLYCQKSQEELRQIAQEAVVKLQEGMSVDDCKLWCCQQVRGQALHVQTLICAE